MLLHQTAQRLTGADFEKNSVRSLDQFTDAISEANGLAQMFRPISGIGRLLCGYPCSGDVRNEWNLRCVAFHTSNQILERRENRLHHRGMESVRCVKRSTGDVLLCEPSLQ